MATGETMRVFIDIAPIVRERYPNGARWEWIAAIVWERYPAYRDTLRDDVEGNSIRGGLDKAMKAGHYCRIIIGGRAWWYAQSQPPQPPLPF